MARIGIGITTRNRSGLLATALTHIIRHLPTNHEVKIVIVDDYSDDKHFDKLLDIAQECNSKVTFVFKAQREGVAAAKNDCLKRLVGADYIFLFDDDIWPVQDGWADIYINSGLQHAMYMREELHNPKLTAETNQFTIHSMHHCSGALLFLTNKTLGTVGGMSKEYIRYGFEHMGYSFRIFRSGINGNLGPYLSIKEAESYFHSLDFELGSLGGSNISTVSQDERDMYYSHNRKVWIKESSDGPIYQEL